MGNNKFEWENYKGLAGRIVLILVIPLLMYFWGLAIISNIANFWGFFTPTASSTFSKDLVGRSLPVLPPILSKLPGAVKGSKLGLSGYAQEGLQVKIYLNAVQVASLRAGKDGQFSFDGLALDEGSNEIYARAVDDHQVESNPSVKVTVKYLKKPPFLELTNLGDNAEIKQKETIFTLVGKTQTGATVAINNSLVFVDNDGNFNYPFTLSDGQNTITAVATDEAGNTTKVERAINFTKQP